MNIIKALFAIVVIIMLKFYSLLLLYPFIFPKVLIKKPSSESKINGNFYRYEEPKSILRDGRGFKKIIKNIWYSITNQQYIKKMQN